MGRRRRLNPLPMITLSISTTTLEAINKLKTKRENQTQFLTRVLAEWQDLRDYRLDMDQVIRLKDRQISNLEYELKEKQLSQNL